MTPTLLKALRRQPRFTAYAVLGLAVGLAIHTVAFSVLYAVLLRPLPFERPQDLFFVYAARPGEERLTLSGPAFDQLVQRSRCFAAASGTTVALTTLTIDGRPEMAQATLVTPGFFRALGVEPALGRGLSSGGGEATEAVVSHGLWRERLGADPEILGRSIQLGESFFTVVGVLPPEVRVPGETSVWLPLDAVPLLFPNLPGLVDDPETRLLRVFARLADGWSAEEARRHLAEVASTLETDHPALWQETTLRLVSFRERAVGHLRAPLVLLQTGAAVLLLLVALNLASLLSTQALRRSRELAVRAALGASTRRLAGRVLGETLTLTVAGGLLGVGLAAGMLEILLALAPAGLPARGHIALHPAVLAVALASAVSAGLVAATPPVLRVLRGDLRGLLAQLGSGGTAVAGGRPGRWGRWGESGLVVVQISLTVALLALAGLLARSYERLAAVDPGFEPRGVLALSLSLPGERYPDPASLERFYGEVSRRISALPAVESVSAASDLPLEGASCSTTLTAAEGLAPAAARRLACLAVAPGLAGTLGIERLRGRDLDPGDLGDGRPAAALINRRLADELWPEGDPLGRHLTLDGDPVPVVGVVADVRQAALEQEVPPLVYLPAYWNNMSLLIRLDPRLDPRGASAAQVAEQAREVVWQVDPRQPVYRQVSLPDLVRDAAADRRFGAWVGGMVAAFALFLGGFGLFGLLSFRLARGVRAVAIRQALGADRKTLLGGVVRQGLLLAALGCLFGLGLAWSLSRLGASWLYGFGGFEPAVGLAVAAVTLATALAASWLPARRAVARDVVELLQA